MRILVVDVGGSQIKVLATGQQTPIRIPSGPDMTAAAMVRDVRTATKAWKYQAVSIGYPGAVLHGKPVAEPRNLGVGWVGFDFKKAFEGVLEPMELAHLPYKKGRTYEEYVGKAGLRRLGKKKWRRTVVDVLKRLKTALEVEDVVVGGGNAKLLRTLPPGIRVGRNANAFVGGYRLWNAHVRR
jgi:polyphosphate glucokinase